MTETNQTPQTTIRGRIQNVPASTVHHLPSRHQPNTPTRKPKGQQKTFNPPQSVPPTEPTVQPEPETEPVPEE